MVLQSMQWPQSLSRLTPWTWPIEWPGGWYSECEWFWWIILPTLRLCYCDGSSGRGVGLQWRSSGPGHSRLNQIWVWVPVTLGTPTINQIINVIKESQIYKLSVSLSGSRISHLLACHWAELSVGSETSLKQTMDLTDLNETVKMIKKEGINAFSSKIIYAWP